MSLQSYLTHASENWKTSLSGILTAVIGLSAVASSPNPWINSAVGVKILGAAAIAKVLLGLIQSDGIQVPGGSTVKQTTTITTPLEGE
jgi:hypothetical protein